MPFKRITAEEIAGQGVAAAPDKLTGKAAENKAVFDRLVREIVTTTFNGLLDALEGTEGAAGIGTAPFEHVPGTTVQGQMQDVQRNHAALREPVGAAFVGAEPFGSVLGVTVQAQLRELLAHHEQLQQEGGAAYLGAKPFLGVPSGTVQGQIQDVQKNVSDIVDGVLPFDSVTEEKLAAGAVTEEKLAAGAVTTAKLDREVVTREKLAPSVSALISALRPGLPPWGDGGELRTGREINRLAGWQQVRFATPMTGTPVLSTALELPGNYLTTPVVAAGTVALRNVTETGFQWSFLDHAGGISKNSVVMHYSAVWKENAI